MSRRDETLDLQVTRDLADLEAALAGEPGADPSLALMVSDVRAEAPRMSAGFALQLDERVAEGFPSPAGRRVRASAWLAGLREHSRANLLPVLGLATTVLVALIVSLAVIAGGGSDTTVRSDRDQAQPPSVATGGAGAESGKSSTVANGPQSVLDEAARRAKAAPAPNVTTFDALAGAPVNRLARKVEKLTQLTLSTSADDVQKVSDGVVRVTQGLGGFVESSQVTTSDARGSATFRLRIPSKRLDEAVSRLSGLAHVGSLSQSATDITREFVSAADRLSDARAERRALLRALGKATTANEIASLRARLRFNRSEIARYKGELNAVRRRADLATVEVTVDGRGKAKDSGAGTWTPRDALRDALRVLEVATGVLVVSAAALVPLALVAALAALAARAVRRRRREEALDAAA